MELNLKQHTVKSYDKDIKSISETIEDLLTLVLQSIDMVEELMKNPNEQKEFLEKITDHDYKINSLDNLVEKKVTSMLALRQPMAIDLRFVVSAIKVAGDLERIGDQAKSIIKKMAYIEEQIDDKTKGSLFKMLDIARIMVGDAVHAFINHDADKAKAVLEKDDDIDHIYLNLFNILERDSSNRREIKTIFNVLFISKNFERLADHSTNIAEVTNYVISGDKD